MTDLVSALDLSLFPNIGLAIFGLVFLAVTVRALLLPREHARHAAALPIDDAETERTHG